MSIKSMTETHKNPAHGCQARTASGQPCRMKPIKGRRYCFNHSPEHLTQRAEARRTGGQHTRTPHAGALGNVISQPRDIPSIMTILDYALAETLALDNGIQRGRLLVSIAAAYGDLHKTGELETQLKELLRVLELREK